jgi:hypothetical protein
MLGRNPLWVAKQHGHRIATMLSVYAAWVEGARECDLAAIRRAMGYNRKRLADRTPTAVAAAAPPTASTPRVVPGNFLTGAGTEFDRFTIRFSVDTSALEVPDMGGEKSALVQNGSGTRASGQEPHWPKIGQRQETESV